MRAMVTATRVGRLQDKKHFREQAAEVYRQVLAAKNVVASLEQTRCKSKEVRSATNGFSPFVETVSENHESQRFDQIRRELMLSNLCSDSEGSADLAVPISPVSTSSESCADGQGQKESGMRLFVGDVRSFASGSRSALSTDGKPGPPDQHRKPGLQSLRNGRDESADELCWTLSDRPLESLTSWTEVCTEEITCMDQGCSLQEARAFCHMCLLQADQARLEHCHLTGQVAEDVAESPGELVSRIGSSQEARSFALMCLQAIEDYERENERLRRAKGSTAQLLF